MQPNTDAFRPEEEDPPQQFPGDDNDNTQTEESPLENDISETAPLTNAEPQPLVDPPKKKKRVRRRHFDKESDVEIHAASMNSVILPVTITMLIVIFVILSIGSNGNLFDSLFPTTTTPQGFVAPWGPTASGVSPGEDSDLWKTVLISVAIAVGVVLLVVIMTFIIFCCYKAGHTKFIYVWLMIAVGLLMFGFGGVLIVKLLQRYNIPMDIVSFIFITINIGGLAIVSIFWASPLIVQQIMLVYVSAVMAWALTMFPEWTAWILLVAIAIYDIFAVLCPCCALNQIVDISNERDEPIPGLLYSAALGSGTMERLREEGLSEEELKLKREQDEQNRLREEQYARNRERRAELEEQRKKKEKAERKKRKSRIQAEEMHQPTAVSSSTPPEGPPIVSDYANHPPDVIIDESHLPVPHDHETERAQTDTEAEQEARLVQRRDQQRMEDRSRMVEVKRDEVEDDDDDDIDADGTLGLGLGDFIFYSILIARAALTDWTTLVSCFFSILFGLAMTVVLLALFRHALPALPISIFSATAVYFISRFLFAPFANRTVYLGLVL
ncbi:putative Presenilin like protein [Blattamonas nauphoetae]|uniref:Presenilin like protein n=1 Tax=Blattamonas nauphoetae TaxID=2049346 RepID=A0ABQ9XVY3_9EUKA|nr:putative Presenilin like protein [Blattamonas nauphoetae]